MLAKENGLPYALRVALESGVRSAYRRSAPTGLERVKYKGAITLTDLPTLIQEIEAYATRKWRVLIAIAGPPGSGKSTFAAKLETRLGPSAAVMPMDGFHLENEQLEHMGLLHRKGAPETFDSEGFVDLVRRLRNEHVISYPTFDREADKTVPDGGLIGEDTKIVLVEGNYLLVSSPPWAALAPLFDLKVRLQVNLDEIEARLISRWLDHGLGPHEARSRALGNDMQNVHFVEENSRAPDFMLSTGKNIRCIDTD